jgi:hypothetical protein
MINRNEEIYLTKSDKLQHETGFSSWFSPFDFRGVLAIIAIIGSIGAVIAIYALTHSNGIRMLLASMVTAGEIPTITGYPTDRTEPHSHWEGIITSGICQLVVLLSAYVLIRMVKNLYQRFMQNRTALPLQQVSKYNRHTTTIYVEALDHESSILIPLCSLKTHPVDLVTDERVQLRITQYTRYCNYDIVTFNIRDSPIKSKSSGKIIKLTSTVRVSLFDRILLRKIYDNNGSFTILVIANGVARELDLSTRKPIVPEVESDYYETPQEIRAENSPIIPREIPSTVIYAEMT